MKLKVIEKHNGNGNFPLFKKGTPIIDLEINWLHENSSFAIWGCYSDGHWYSCKINDYNTYVPKIYVKNGKLNQDYNPTELIIKKGQTLTLIKIVFEWLYVKDEKGNEGWIPASKVITI